LMACQPGCECGDCMKPRDTPDPAPVSKNLISSNTQCEFGKYDSEPFPVSGDATYWYARAVYWKRECERNTGEQTKMSLTEPLHESHEPHEPHEPSTPGYKYKYPILKIPVKYTPNDDGSWTSTNPCVEVPIGCGLVALDVLDLMQLQNILSVEVANDSLIGPKITAIKYVRDRTGW